nr:hypothetical protein [Tanacetum cinerariifolium]
EDHQYTSLICQILWGAFLHITKLTLKNVACNHNIGTFHFYILQLNLQLLDPLLGHALTWWNSYVRIVGHAAAYEMPWKTLMKKMNETYCPRSGSRSFFQSVADVLATYDANQNSGNGNGDEDGSYDSGSGGRRTSHTTRGCTYKEFLNCQPFTLKGTEGAVGLSHWIEKIEYVFHISKSTMECQVKYATCTLLGSALTW